MRTELWNNHQIRFVEYKEEWCAVAKDITDALDIKNPTMALKRLDEDYKALTTIEGLNRGNVPVNILYEFGIYKLVLSSRKKEAREFERWVFEVIKSLRESSGLEGFQVFRMLDKEHQKQSMSTLSRALKHPVRVDFIKANTITNKAVSAKHGYPKMLKKGEMTPDMLSDRQGILEDTVELMSINDKFNLGISVAEKIYGTLKM